MQTVVVTRVQCFNVNGNEEGGSDMVGIPGLKGRFCASLRKATP
jgi:hypothetical protein